MIDSGGPSFELWYRAEYPRVLAAILVISGDLDTACDAVDEAFSRSLAHWKRIGKTNSPAGWTYRVALNHLRRIHRRRALERRALGHLAVSDVMPAVGRELWELVGELPPRQREIVVLRYVADLTEAGIGEVLGISRGTVSKTLRDAYARLAEALTEDPIGQPSGTCDAAT